MISNDDAELQAFITGEHEEDVISEAGEEEDAEEGEVLELLHDKKPDNTCPSCAAYTPIDTLRELGMCEDCDDAEAWMAEHGFTEEQLRGGNMLKIYGLTFAFSVLSAVFLGHLLAFFDTNALF